ncbi:MAG TPA: hypothetical protein VFS19_02635, partial [Planctomycetota bacterium]|nr:hypothetical protein [Planctomycetota bacterium]
MLHLVVFLGALLQIPQDEDPAHWIKLLASDKSVERDEAFIRLLKLGEKAAPALTGSKGVAAQDLLALIERRQEKLLEILGRARDEARGDLDRLLWRAHHICVALCEEREWNPVKAILDRAKCPERGRSRSRDGLKLTYALLAPAWTSKAGARFELQLEFSIDPAPSADEASRILMGDPAVELVLWSGAPLADLRESLSKDTFLGASVHEPVDAEFTLVRSASLHYRSWGAQDAPMSWEFWLWIYLKPTIGAKELTRRFEGWRVSGELKDFRMDKSEVFEPSRGSQGSVSRIDPPQVQETSDLDRLKPPNCQTAYGPGDLKTLPADITGLVLSGEGILQRDFNRISRFTSLKYLEL